MSAWPFTSALSLGNDAAMAFHPDAICLVGAAVVAVAGGLFDLRACHQIPNGLTLPAIIAGIALNGMLYGWRGAVSASAAVLIAFAVMSVLYFMKTMGGADVKLMAAVGAFAAMDHVFLEMVCTAIAGGIIALALFAYKKQLRRGLVNVYMILLHHLHGAMLPVPEMTLDAPGALKMPYGTAIAAGSIAVLFFTRGN